MVGVVLIAGFSWLQEGESSDEGEDPSHSGANEKEGVDSNYEYSEEETDEEVRGGCEGGRCEGVWYVVSACKTSTLEARC